MTPNKLKEILTEKKSYLKKGKMWLSQNFNIPIEQVEQVINEMRSVKSAYRGTSPRVGKMDYFKEKAKISPENASKSILYKFKVKNKSKSGKNVLIIGDLHCPFEQKGYLEHCKDVYDNFDCTEVVFIGDLLDNHAISYHEHDADGRSPFDEYELAVKSLHKWYKVFPEAKVCLGNHDLLGVRKIYTAGLPRNWMKSLEQIVEAPNTYNFDMHHEIDGVLYIHGTGVSGDNGAMKIATQNRQSAVIGHLHSISNIKYSASYRDLIFAMTVGCGLDYKQYAFHYGKDIPAKPIVSCGVVLSGRIPVLIPMEL